MPCRPPSWAIRSYFGFFATDDVDAAQGELTALERAFSGLGVREYADSVGRIAPVSFSRAAEPAGPGDARAALGRPSAT